MKQNITFERWLLQQRFRDDPVGDLANDFYRAKKQMLAKGIKNIKCDIEHLNIFQADECVYKTLIIAQKEFEDLGYTSREIYKNK